MTPHAEVTGLVADLASIAFECRDHAMAAQAPVIGVVPRCLVLVAVIAGDPIDVTDRAVRRDRIESR